MVVTDDGGFPPRYVTEIERFPPRHFSYNGPPMIATAESKPAIARIVTDLAALAGEKFGTIYADPPWQYDNQNTRAGADHQYDTMSIDEITALPIRELGAPQSHLHLWTTSTFLFHSKTILDAWGYEYKSSFIWIKPRPGFGNYWRLAHEILILGVRGSLPFNDHATMSWMRADRGAHSVKPHDVRRLIERVSPGPRLELFGRQPADGWTVYGNEIEIGMFDHDVEHV